MKMAGNEKARNENNPEWTNDGLIECIPASQEEIVVEASIRREIKAEWSEMSESNERIRQSQ